MVDRRQCPLSALLLACVLGPTSAATNGERQAGDVLSYALPASVLGAGLWRGDRDGARQFAASFAATVVTAEILKRATDVERPDRTNDQSFPSGHAARAFAAATFVHRRHGVEAALPLYGVAAYVGYTRVQSDRHRIELDLRREGPSDGLAGAPADRSMVVNTLAVSRLMCSQVCDR